jgi:hypothetical protein
MKLFTILSAGFIAAAAMLPGSANSQSRHSNSREVHVTRTEVVRHDNVRRGNNWNRGHHYGRDNYRTRRVCNTVWRHGHRQRVCRTVRR